LADYQLFTISVFAKRTKIVHFHAKKSLNFFKNTLL